MGMLLRNHSRGVILALSVFAIAVHFLCVSPVYGDPVWGDKFTFEQPDGKKVDVRIWGDEFYRVVESLDGYTLTRDPNTGEICYARLSSDGNTLVSTGYPRTNIRSRELVPRSDWPPFATRTGK